MASLLMVILGLTILAACLYDFALTTFLASGQGPITAKINHIVYQIFFNAAGKKATHPLLKYVGIAIIFSIIFVWVSLLWIGLLIIFSAFPDSVLNGQTKEATDVIEKFYFVGFTLSTLGVGDFIPGNDIWRAITAFCAFLGLITITTSITYLVPVLSNAVHKRSLAMQISDLGATPEQIVINSFNGKDFSEISTQLANLTPEIHTYIQNQLAYPVLHHMHANNHSENIVLQFSKLDEALSIFILHVPVELQPQRLELQLTRRALTSYFEAVSYMKFTEKAPPLPDFELIQNKIGNTLEYTANPQEKYKLLSRRRKLLYSNLISDGWQWDDLYNQEYSTDFDIEFARSLL
ncbi:potassium channel family protein [Catalinimonas sp. 4WD22]|uniref:potassium channel family protein n=1 Tax=Catalinimonas locisalis TaxID=3133978 RepID=UPI00310139E3